jgi:hypothetical protein
VIGFLSNDTVNDTNLSASVVDFVWNYGLIEGFQALLPTNETSGNTTLNFTYPLASEINATYAVNASGAA